jgi:hypothetical protein
MGNKLRVVGDNIKAENFARYLKAFLYETLNFKEHVKRETYNTEG